MHDDTTLGLASPLASVEAQASRDRWEPPTVQVICLACEISAYAPDGDIPLF